MDCGDAGNFCPCRLADPAKSLKIAIDPSASSLMQHSRCPLVEAHPLAGIDLPPQSLVVRATNLVVRPNIFSAFACWALVLHGVEFTLAFSASPAPSFRTARSDQAQN